MGNSSSAKKYKLSDIGAGVVEDKKTKSVAVTEWKLPRPRWKRTEGTDSKSPSTGSVKIPYIDNTPIYKEFKKEYDKTKKVRPIDPKLDEDALEKIRQEDAATEKREFEIYWRRKWFHPMQNLTDEEDKEKLDQAAKAHIDEQMAIGLYLDVSGYIKMYDFVTMVLAASSIPSVMDENFVLKCDVVYKHIHAVNKKKGQDAITKRLNGELEKAGQVFKALQSLENQAMNTDATKSLVDSFAKKMPKDQNKDSKDGKEPTNEITTAEQAKKQLYKTCLMCLRIWRDVAQDMLAVARREILILRDSPPKVRNSTESVQLAAALSTWESLLRNRLTDEIEPSIDEVDKVVDEKRARMLQQLQKQESQAKASKAEAARKEAEAKAAAEAAEAAAEEARQQIVAEKARLKEEMEAKKLRLDKQRRKERTRLGLPF